MMDNTNITLLILDMNSPHCATRVEKAAAWVASFASSTVVLSARTTTLYSFTTTGITCRGCVDNVTKIQNK